MRKQLLTGQDQKWKSPALEVPIDSWVLMDMFDTGMAEANPKSSLDMQMQSYKFSRYTAGLGSQRTYTFPPVARQHWKSGMKTSLTIVDCRGKQLDFS